MYTSAYDCSLSAQKKALDHASWLVLLFGTSLLCAHFGRICLRFCDIHREASSKSLGAAEQKPNQNVNHSLDFFKRQKQGINTNTAVDSRYSIAHKNLLSLV